MTAPGRPAWQTVQLYGGYAFPLDHAVKRRGIDFRDICAQVLKDYGFRCVVDCELSGKRTIYDIQHRSDIVVHRPGKAALHLKTVWQDDPGSNEKWAYYAINTDHLELETLVVLGGEGAAPKAVAWANRYARGSKFFHGVVTFQEFVIRCLDGNLIP